MRRISKKDYIKKIKTSPTQIYLMITYFDGVNNSTIPTIKQMRFSMWEATSSKCSGTRPGQPHSGEGREDSV